MTDLEVLRAARRLLLEKGWTQGAGARNAAGKQTLSTYHDAECFCALGAIARARSDAGLPYSSQASSALEKHLNVRVPGGDIFEFNDAKGRTREEVVAVFDCAIVRLEKQLAGRQLVLGGVSP